MEQTTLDLTIYLCHFGIMPTKDSHNETDGRIVNIDHARTGTAKCAQSLTKSDKRKKSEARAALRAGASIKEAAQVAGMNADHLCVLIKRDVSFRKAKLEGDEVADGLIQTSLVKILADPSEESRDKISAAQALARYKRLGGFGAQELRIGWIPAGADRENI